MQKWLVFVTFMVACFESALSSILICVGVCECGGGKMGGGCVEVWECWGCKGLWAWGCAGEVLCGYVGVCRCGVEDVGMALWWYVGVGVWGEFCHALWNPLQKRTTKN